MQLGTVGSKSTVNFGAEVQVVTAGLYSETYVDIVNLDRYNMIIGMPFMRTNKVLLDFERNKVIINGMEVHAIQVEAPEVDDRICCYRSTDKRNS